MSTAAPAKLSTYLTYLTFVVGNVVSEDFVSASASTPEYNSCTNITTALRIVYLIAIYCAVSTWATTSVIAVNSTNMASRTAY